MNVYTQKKVLIYMQPETRAALIQLAKAKEISMSAVVAQAIQLALDEYYQKHGPEGEAQA